jgi:hypothetical protein
MNDKEASLILGIEDDFSKDEREERIEYLVFETKNYFLTHPTILPVTLNKMKGLQKIIEASDYLKLFNELELDYAANALDFSLNHDCFFELYDLYIKCTQKIKLQISNSIQPHQLKAGLINLFELQKNFEENHLKLFQQNTAANLFFEEKGNHQFDSIKISQSIDHYAIKKLILEIGLENKMSPDLLDWGHFSKNLQLLLVAENARIFKSNRLVNKT